MKKVTGTDGEEYTIEPEANLRRANLSSADLSNIDLSGTDLNGTDLSNIDLSGADLSEIDLSHADLSGADLSGVFLNDGIVFVEDFDPTNLSVYPIGLNTKRFSLIFQFNPTES